MAGRRKVWITRTEPGASATAARVRDLGFEPVVAPLLVVRQIPDVPIELGGVCALAFTSANAVRAFAERCSERELKVFAVGQATAKAARDWRFRTVLSTDGGVAQLAAGIAARRRELSRGAVLHPGAKESAGDLAGALEKDGIELRSLALYETVEAGPPEAVLAQLPKLWGVLVHSPKAAKALAAVLKARPATQLRAFAISAAAARPLGKSGLAAVAAAASPNEDALLALLKTDG
jgi:uroporphyrinogen-III synthase